MPGEFRDRVVLVTGAGSGIGRATAIAFAREGARVVVADRNATTGQETVRLIGQTGGTAIFVETDVAREDRVQALVEKTLATYGRLDSAVNNAGVEGTLATTVDYPASMWNRVLEINLTGVWLGMKYEIPPMLRQGGGAIVNISSILGLVGFADTAAYTASKHGIIGLTRVATLEYAARGIRVNAVCPGFIETPMVMERGVRAGASRETYERIANLHPAKRLGKPEEVAAAVLWLCSDAASFVMGAVLTVDGGYTAQ